MRYTTKGLFDNIERKFPTPNEDSGLLIQEKGKKGERNRKETTVSPFLTKRRRGLNLTE